MPHDVGGSLAGQPIPGRGQRAVFEKPWHARALAVTIAAGALGKWTLDASRHARECLGKPNFRSMSYFERWLAALTNLLVIHGLVTKKDLAEHPVKACPAHARILVASDVDRFLSKGNPTSRPASMPARFAIGDRVRTRRPNPESTGGHSRLPEYANDRIGVVLQHHGHHVFPDSNAVGEGECSQPLYSVAFEGGELWKDCSADEVILDIWECYLVAA